MNQLYFCRRILSRLKNKTTITILGLVVLFLTLAPPALALETGIGYGTLTGLGTTDLRVTIMRVIQVALGFVGVIAIIIIMYAGYMWMTSGGNAEKIDTAKRILTNAVIGLVIIFLAFAIVSFIINQLIQATIGGGTGPGGRPGGCDNCGHLGTGIIEWVYPAPNAHDVWRNTAITVAFKVQMKPDTIIAGAPAVCTAAAPCSGNIASDVLGTLHVQIQSTGAPLPADQVTASSSDGRIYVFRPHQYLGDGINNVWYSVKLTNAIQKDNGDSAFPGSSNYFLWRFEVGRFLDLDPVETDNVFPPPDNLPDAYSKSAATLATGSITVASLPLLAQNASTQPPVTTAGTQDMTVSGTYNCAASAVLCINYDGTNFIVNPKVSGSAAAGPSFCGSATAMTVDGITTSAKVTNGTATIGCGLTLSVANLSGSGSQWYFGATAQRAADTLRIGNKQYSFASGTAGSGQISVGATTAATAANIATKVNADNIGVDASVSVNVVRLTAHIAGAAGNTIPVLGSGSWYDISPMSGGQDLSLLPTTKDVPDKKRNATIVINFNEAIDATKVNASTIKVEYVADVNQPDTWTAADGTYSISNMGKTVEFLSNNGCTDAGGQPIKNACGDKMYCLPINNSNPDLGTYAPTHYRVKIIAGMLKTCDDAANKCLDTNFNTCDPIAATPPGNGDTVCRALVNSVKVFYPEAQTSPNGIVDMANNSFNGNNDTYTLNSQVFGKADGPQVQDTKSPYELNKVCSNNHAKYCTVNSDCGSGNKCATLPGEQGDDLVWSFYVNKDVDLSAPALTDVNATVSSTGVSLTAPVKGTFDKVMMSSTLKSGSNYQDGLCYCTQSTQCNTANGESCDVDASSFTYRRCVNTDPNKQAYCAQNSECKDTSDKDTAGNVIGCVNKKYITLIDKATQPVGWWITKNDLDTVLPLDGYADQTQSQLNHTTFLQVTNYGAEVGSGVKDVYQNCYIPSQGPKAGVCSQSGGGCGNNNDCPGGATDLCISACDPKTGAGCCQSPSDLTANPPRVYCCNGQAVTQYDWEHNSQCFTGY